MKKVIWSELTTIEKNELLQRSAVSDDDILRQQTLSLIHQVREQGDEALIALTKQFDQVELTSLLVTEEEFAQARNEVSAQDLKTLRFAINRNKAYCTAQLPENWIYDSNDGVICERQWRAISRVGLYVPGGTACLFSTVIMVAIPALIAGCEQKVICTPPSKDGTIHPMLIVAAQECGINQIFKVGGAQAIAAMAYGTQSVPKVDKIFGPGNKWVTQAKLICSQNDSGVSIDLPAGPSEILVIADESANASFVAADLLSQAEHDIASQVILVSSSETVVEKVFACVKEQLEQLPRREIITKALAKSCAIIVNTIAEGINISNVYAPEHLSLQVENPRQYLSQIQNAGTVFLGNWTPETLGDFVTGANHVLPTAGGAKMRSGLSVLDFMKTVGVQEASQEGLLKLGPYAQRIAQVEQLQAHEVAVTIRLKGFTNA